MLSDKELKKRYRQKFWENPDRYYATNVLKEEGFERRICEKCGKPFWSVEAERYICGDPGCSNDESFSFIGKTPAGRKIDYVGIWKEFSRIFQKLGYTPIKRYPVVARWNPTMEFTNASIAAFQPFVISGEVAPPANPLIIPQFCLRFPDIDNVGVTMSHNTGFVMIGQHMFVKPEAWDQNKVFSDIYIWLREGLRLPKDEIIFHEDAWAGGGNLGCCMEFFSRGCELGNQVYMLYEQTASGIKELDLRVLDMGMGMERNAWFSLGVNTMYDAQFPTVLKKLLDITAVRYDSDLLKRYVPYAGILNLDEVDDVEIAWNRVASQVGISVAELKDFIIPLSGIYSIAEHSRSLLVAINDGALPSNVGGGYNLRMLARRIFSFINRFGWDIYLPDVCRWHAKYLKPVFPELLENLDDVEKILIVEEKKYRNTLKKTNSIVSRIIHKEITTDTLLELYDSKGISPDLVAQEAKKLGKKIKIPENFYALVSELHTKKEQLHATNKGSVIDTAGLPETKAEYFGDWRELEFKAKVLRIEGKYVVLDRTRFYPTSGGQLHDTGYIGNIPVVEVFKQGAIIVHKLEGEAGFSTGDIVQGRVDFERRKQLAQHHTAAHIINAAARMVLGRHVNQAGAKKTLEKAHLDVTHYQLISDDEIIQIEKIANEIVKKDIPIYKRFYPRDVAEKKFGMNIYQGGAVPGKEVRIVEIPGVDVEACGGTHLNSTGEVENITITKVNKIQDGVIRITYTAGAASIKARESERAIIEELMNLTGVPQEKLVPRCEEIFRKWKQIRKAIRKKKQITRDMFSYTNPEEYEDYRDNILPKLSEVLKTPAEHLPSAVKKFLGDIEKWRLRTLDK